MHIIKKYKRSFWWSLGLSGIGTAVFLLFIGFLQLSGNFHQVIEGELFRSAQLSAHEIERAHRDHNIQTIVNLRGQAHGVSWYKNETVMAQKLNIDHIDFDMDSNEFLSLQKVNDLLAIMKDAKKPILIHCKSGADRAGLASALYVAGIAGGTEKEAENQLSIRYGHFSWPFLGEYNMDRSFEMMEPHFGFTKS